MAARNTDSVSINAGLLRRVADTLEQSLLDDSWARTLPNGFWQQDLDRLNQVRAVLGRKPLVWDEQSRSLK